MGHRVTRPTSQHRWTAMSSAFTHQVFIKLLLPARCEVMTVSGLGTFSWGSGEFTGEQLHKIMADWHNNAGNKCSVIERDGERAS